jgi:hypothetical protein
LLLVLCVHGSKHCWEQLKWLCDVAELVRQPDLDWSRIEESATRTRVRRMVALALALSRDVLDVELPTIAARLTTDPALANLCRRMRACVAHGVDPAPTEIRRLVLYARMRERYVDELAVYARYAAQWLSRVFVPNDLDRAAVKLPAAMRLAYYAVRPIRVLRERLRSRA